jgi:hypothetical protein
MTPDEYCQSLDVVIMNDNMKPYNSRLCSAGEAFGAAPPGHGGSSRQAAPLFHNKGGVICLILL